MKKLMKKKVNVFGKGVPMFVIALFAMGLVSAALLGYYGVITGMAVVSQSVILEDNEVTGAWNTNLVAGKTIIDCDTDSNGHSVRNNADVEATIQFGTICGNTVGQDDGTITYTDIDWSTFGNNRCDGIETEIYGILELTTKTVVFGSSPWAENDDAEATVKYNIVGSNINAEVIDYDGITLSDYTLIYYKDNSDRFNDPAQAIKLDSITGSLPYGTDGNLDEYNYCEPSGFVTTGEDYVHCHGAKIWLVPNGALTNCDGNGVCDIAWGQASNFLFETDLIVYSDDVDNKITLPANGGGFNFCVEQDFALNLVPDTYTIETKILPVI